jgi:hypothetical protein
MFLWLPDESTEVAGGTVEDIIASPLRDRRLSR